MTVTPSSDMLLLSSFICAGISVIIYIITLAELCVSPAHGSELKAIPYRFVNCVASICIIFETICSIMHYLNTSNELWSIAFIITRGMAVIILTIGGTLFVLITFDTLYQSALSKQSAPPLLRFIFKLLGGFIFPVIITGCIILSIAYQQIFWVRLSITFMLISISALSVLVMIGLIIVIRKMNAVRCSIEKPLKTPNETESNDPQKHARAQVIGLRKKCNQLIIVSIILFIQCTVVTSLAIQRLTSLQKPKEAGGLNQEILDFKGYLESMSMQFIAMCVLMSWIWIKINCRTHRDNFTIFYLCCMGEPNVDLQHRKSFTFTNLFAGNKHVSGDNDQVKEDTITGLTVFTPPLNDGDVAILVPMVSFPHNRDSSKHISVKICILNIEILFFSLEIFDFMKKKFNIDRINKNELINSYLGGDDYYNELIKHLEKWYHKKCLFFITHSLLKTEELRKLLLKLDLLRFFVGNNMENIVALKKENVNMDWRERIIARDSAYNKLLRNDKSNLEIHLIILQFLQIFNIDNDEILYIDCNESITKYMKEINICKILKVNSHQIGKLKLKQLIDQQTNNPYELRQSLSIQLSEVIEYGQHPIINEQVFELIDNLLLQLHDND